tara:strand:+ start:3109 stop:3834 length:726 start_codon:yes stop_codon:yes gene_type:complete
MTTNNILLSNEFNKDLVTFLPPRQNKLGGQSILVNYNNGDNPGPFFLQTCRVRIPFGIDSSKPENGPVKYHISLSMANADTQNEQLHKLTGNIRDIDEKAKAMPVQNDLWFGKKLSGELVNEFYKSAEKFPKDPKWPSNLKVKLPFDMKKGDPLFRLYDENKKPINVLDENGEINSDAIPRGCEAVCLIQTTGVWFVGKTQFGVGYKLVQAKIYKSNKLTGYSIVDSEDDEEEVEVEVSDS